MKTLLMFLFLILSINVLNAQENYFNEESKKSNLTKEEKREQKRIENTKKMERVKGIVESKRFVLEADYLSNQRGEKVPVHSNLNFILIDSLNALVQVGSIRGIGSNGLGGVTLDGNVKQYDVTLNKKANGYGIRIFISSLGGACDVYMTVNPNGNSTATVTGLFPGYLMYHGRMVPLHQSKVYKGKSF